MQASVFARALVAAGAVVAVIAVVIATGGGRGGHRLILTVRDATDVVPGQFVNDAGVNVGKVDSISAVKGGHAARIGLTLNGSVWPLRRGTKMVLRWGGTVSYVNRYIRLEPGPVGNPSMATDGIVPGADFSSPVEFDSLVNTFTAPVRKGLGAFLRNAGLTLSDASPALRRALDGAPAALAQTSHVLADLNANEAALNTLVRSGARVVASVRAANPGIGPLVHDAKVTFAALASRARQLDATLATAPSTLVRTRATLASAQPTLRSAQVVAGRLAPGVTQVRHVAAPLDGLLVTLKQVGPDAISALRSAREATPSLNPLLVKAAGVLPQLRSIARQSVTSLQCIRPYTPDIIAFASDWADFISGVDGKDHYFRAQVQTLVPAPGNAMPYDSAQLQKLMPWISYVFPPPPGYAAGQPWFLSQCNEGPNTLLAAADPENNAAAAQLPAANAKPISLPEGK